MKKNPFIHLTCIYCGSNCKAPLCDRCAKAIAIQIKAYFDAKSETEQESGTSKASSEELEKMPSCA